MKLRLIDRLITSSALVIALLSAFVLHWKGGKSFSVNANDAYGMLEWYNSLHVGTIIYTTLHYAFYKKHFIHLSLPFLSGLILIFDMYQHKSTHNVLAGLFILLSLYTILFDVQNYKGQLRKYILFMIIVFGLVAGYFSKLYNISTAELIVMLIVGLAKEREQYEDILFKKKEIRSVPLEEKN